MKLEAVQFFQSVPLPSDNAKRSPLITSAKHPEFDITLDGYTITLRTQTSKKAVYVTLFNTCWYTALEVPDESIPSPSAPARATKTKIKSNAVAEVKFP